MDHTAESAPAAAPGEQVFTTHIHANMNAQPDVPMDNADESMNTVTQSTITPLPELGYSNGQSQESRPHTSYSDTGFQRAYQSDHQANYSGFSHHSDADTPPRYASSYQAQGYNPPSRPGSGMGRAGQYPDNQRAAQQQQQDTNKNTSVVIKVGMVGDAQIGKTSLMVKYVEGSWDEDYIQTLGVNFMEKTISIRNTEITFSIWDLGGQREFVNMLPLVCNDAVAILFMFDLTRKSTLNSIKEWYRQGRGFNKTAIPFLVGTKYDHFVNFPREEQEEISNQVRLLEHGLPKQC